MYQREATVKSVIGLHARPATLVVKQAMEFKSKLTITYNGKEIDAKGMFAVMGAGINGGAKILVSGTGEDEMEAVDKLVNLIETIED